MISILAFIYHTVGRYGQQVYAVTVEICLHTGAVVVHGEGDDGVVGSLFDLTLRYQATGAFLFRCQAVDRLCIGVFRFGSGGRSGCDFTSGIIFEVILDELSKLGTDASALGVQSSFTCAGHQTVIHGPRDIFFGPGGNLVLVRILAQIALSAGIVVLELSVIRKERSDLFPGNGSVGLEGRRAGAAGDAVFLTPTYGVVVPGTGSDVFKRCVTGSVSGLAFQIVQHLHHLSTGNSSVRIELGLGLSAHVIVIQTILNSRFIPGAGGDVGHVGCAGSKGIQGYGRGDKQNASQRGGKHAFSKGLHFSLLLSFGKTKKCVTATRPSRTETMWQLNHSTTN